MTRAGKILRKRAGEKLTGRGGESKLSRGAVADCQPRQGREPPVLTDCKWTFRGSYLQGGKYVLERNMIDFALCFPN